MFLKGAVQDVIFASLVALAPLAVPLMARVAAAVPAMATWKVRTEVGLPPGVSDPVEVTL